MTQEIAASMMIALAIVLLGLAWWGWRNRRVRFRHLEGSLVRTLPASPSLLSFEGLYVATTLADQPMDRVPVGPLSFRAKAKFSIHREGLVVGAQGEAPVVLGSEGGLEAGLATWTIDRVVEPDGLLMIRWSLNGTALDSYLRIVHTDTGKIIETVNSLRGKTGVTNDRAVLVLEDGSRFEGSAWGARGETLGEVVFSTGMTGYQETLTDPSYAGQIVVMTAPHIGNTGMNDEDPESRRIWVDGFVVRDPARRPSNFRSTRSLDDDLVSDGIVSISGVDTRAITLILREAGVMRGGIFSGDHVSLEAADQLERVRNAVDMKGQNLSDQVSVQELRVVPALGDPLGRLVVMDLGVKESTLHHLASRGFDVHVLPSTATFDEVMSVKPVALFYSNGPGDPSASDHHVALLQKALGERLPFFGICFGNQLLGRALGFDTYKLKYGHRGINQPVLDKTTGKVEITAQNHGFAVEAPRDGVVDSPAGFGKVQVSHVSLNDDVVEGLTALDVPAFSVQYHPEAAAGPHDSTYLFDRFRALVTDALADSNRGDR